jgi:hypothetical protein
MKYFRSRAALLDAEELKDEMAAQLLNNSKRLLEKTEVDMKRQKRQVPQVNISYLYIIHYIY